MDVELVRHIRSVQNEVEGKRPWFGPVFILGADELLGAELLRIRLFSGRVGDGVGFGTKSTCPQQAEMSKSTTAELLADGRPRETKGITHMPRTAIFLPGPAPARTRGLHVVRPAHIIGAAASEEMLSGILNVKYS